MIDRFGGHTRGVPSPLVEAVAKHKGDWKIGDSTGSHGRTNNVDHEMYVPLNDDFCRCGRSHGDVVRSHELIHAKISPESPRPIKVEHAGVVTPVSTVNVEAAEEFRVGKSLAIMEGRNVLKDYGCAVVVPQIVSSLMDEGKYADVVRYAIAGGPSPVSDKVREALLSYRQDMKALLGETPKEKADMRKQINERMVVASALTDAIPSYMVAAERMMMLKGDGLARVESLEAAVEEYKACIASCGSACSDCAYELQEARDGLAELVVDKAGGELPSWRSTEQLAAFLEVNLKDLANQIRDLLAGPPAPTPDLDKILGKPDHNPDLSPTARVAPAAKSDLGDFKTTRSNKVVWGKPDAITKAAMPLALPPWKLQRVARAVDEGTIPRYMHRWPSDKRVFARTKRLPGGTLLVDDSGSMGLSAEELDRIIDMLPVATVAVYAGEDGLDGGEIRVVAQDGKRAVAEDLSTPYGGNGIDGPALEWLGEQNGPRIWITDGGVSSISHGFEQEAKDDAHRLCVKHKINVARSVEVALKRLKENKLAR